MQTLLKIAVFMSLAVAGIRAEACESVKAEGARLEGGYYVVDYLDKCEQKRCSIEHGGISYKTCSQERGTPSGSLNICEQLEAAKDGCLVDSYSKEGEPFPNCCNIFTKRICPGDEGYSASDFEWMQTTLAWLPSSLTQQCNRK